MMRYKKQYSQYRQSAITLRRKGKTYLEIQQACGVSIPKSTLSTWLAHEVLSAEEKFTLSKNSADRIRKARDKGLATLKAKRIAHLKNIEDGVAYLENVFLKNDDIAKISLAMLYWCEGSKGSHAGLSFGNSDPSIIKFFFSLMRRCYTVDESKFRITLECRADQNVEALEGFWSSLTKISRKQFYRARIDPRTIGKPTKKARYKGVCRIEYFSANIYNELKAIWELLSGPVV